MRAARAIGRGDLNQQIDIRSGDEVEELAARAVTMHRRVEGPVAPLAASQDLADVRRLMHDVRRRIGEADVRRYLVVRRVNCRQRRLHLLGRINPRNQRSIQHNPVPRIRRTALAILGGRCFR